MQLQMPASGCEKWLIKLTLILPVQLPSRALSIAFKQLFFNRTEVAASVLPVQFGILYLMIMIIAHLMVALLCAS